MTLKVTDSFGQMDESHVVVTVWTEPETGPVNGVIATLGGAIPQGLTAQKLNDHRKPKAIVDPRIKVFNQPLPRSEKIRAEIKAAKQPSRNHYLTTINRKKGLSSQSVAGAEFDSPFPYIISKTTDLYIESWSQPFGKTLHKPSSSLSVNGGGASGWEFVGCTDDDSDEDLFPDNCEATITDASFINNFKAGKNDYLFNFKARPVDGAHSAGINVGVLAGLRVPRIGLNILPDAQMNPADSRQFSFSSDGKTEFFQQINIPESQITSDGYVGFTIPVYAVDENGNFLKNFSGIFNAVFNDMRLYSYAPEGVMVNGRSEIYVYVPISEFSDGVTELNLTDIVLTTDGGCDNSGNGRIRYLQGCELIPTTHELPQGLATYNQPSISGQALLSAQSLSCQVLFGRLNKSVFNKIGYGKDSKARRDFDASIRDYESSVAGIVISVIPIAGDAIDLIAQGYWCITGQEADLVIVTLAFAGLALDSGTGVLDVTAGVKALYKLGGPTAQAAIRLIIDEIKSSKRTPAQAYEVLKTSFGFFQKIGAKNGVKYRESINESLELAREGTASPLSAVQLYNFSYNKFWGIVNPNGANRYPPNLLIKIAKYGMFAPETAKAMAKCGSWCILDIGKITQLLSSYRNSQINSIKEFEQIFKNIIPENLSNRLSFARSKGVVRCVLNVSVNKLTSLNLNSQSTSNEECKESLLEYPGSENYIWGSVPDGFLDIIVDASKSESPRGRQMFNELWATLSKYVTKGIRGTWTNGDTYKDNFLTFVALKKEKYSDYDAAMGTWTGKMARSVGFNMAKVNVTRNSAGEITDVAVEFTK